MATSRGPGPSGDRVCSECPHLGLQNSFDGRKASSRTGIVLHLHPACPPCLGLTGALLSSHGAENLAGPWGQSGEQPLAVSNLVAAPEGCPSTSAVGAGHRGPPAPPQMGSDTLSPLKATASLPLSGCRSPPSSRAVGERSAVPTGRACRRPPSCESPRGGPSIPRRVTGSVACTRLAGLAVVQPRVSLGSWLLALFSGDERRVCHLSEKSRTWPGTPCLDRASCPHPVRGLPHCNPQERAFPGALAGEVAVKPSAGYRSSGRPQERANISNLLLVALAKEMTPPPTTMCHSLKQGSLTTSPCTFRQLPMRYS